ncbi:HAD-IIB family hydrolase [Sinorhizobium meliloti WSM1022]|jgi:HAD superfamily hydrolase (TIGR01484 family)|uniref:HAD family hydrolase n=2 Tax=Sinorhizobium TaxID=28105 RepID=H0G326_RHIML|nr:MULTISPECIES: HAD-IIB family hydrolase [Sinorhizobium]ASQ02875.1 HAD family hydrolase [Sinorhizobium meliloti]EHK76294.1 HAD family hydrolase [Sinorhizobium meliloti CCNWSX0020]MCO6421203.1 HAD-IIB family hydrolase [Sinorhizobium meliloti]MDW9408598.1 HAD-IIB family hydrolase [Sinorhizobium meliloti]MDW9441324.1 HAD-IIB family hydrolase [Sinorhizobium meliloti]
MRAVTEMPIDVAARITVLFADIDDTLTNEGLLPAAAYDAVERLTEAGVAVAPITGRPAGWCDMIARMWPVAGVVGENGAFYFAYDRTRRRMRRSFAIADAQRAADREKLARVRARILAEVQGAAVSADQLYREADLAIDFCEDVPTLPVSDVDRIKRIFEEEGAVAKVSSIHVNGWYGAYDKLTMTRRFADDILGVDIDAERDRIVFVGDSPNDAPMFGFFPNACGVANVLAFQGRIDAEPAYVAEREGGHGFVEVANRILDARSGRSAA